MLPENVLCPTINTQLHLVVFPPTSQSKIWKKISPPSPKIFCLKIQQELNEWVKQSNLNVDKVEGGPNLRYTDDNATLS